MNGCKSKDIYDVIKLCGMDLSEIMRYTFGVGIYLEVIK